MKETSLHTEQQYREQMAACRALFVQKLHDYTASWRVLRPSSLTDQLLIKVLRIRNISTIGKNLIGDSIRDEFIGLVNYGFIGIIQCELGASDGVDLSNEEALSRYDALAHQTFELMMRKNHDYGEAWRQMRISSYTDLILTKILRIKQIEDLKGATQASEGVDANYQDIVNYALFALIRLSEANADLIKS